jgi:hypothetical protein
MPKYKREVLRIFPDAKDLIIGKFDDKKNFFGSLGG